MDQPYDPTTPLGNVRLLIADTNVAADTFSDAEINVFLSMAGQVVMLAASYALDALAADQSRLAASLTIESGTVNLTDVATNLRDQAKRWRDLTIIPPVVVSPIQKFRPNYRGRPGNMDIW
jgi:hypothetical protein